MNTIIERAVSLMNEATDFFQIESIISDAVHDYYDVRHFGLQKIVALKSGRSAQEWETERADKWARYRADMDGVRGRLYAAIPAIFRNCRMFFQYKQTYNIQ